MRRVIIPFCLFIIPVGFYLSLVLLGKNTYKIPIYHPADYTDHNPYTVPPTLHPYLKNHKNTLVSFIDNQNILTTIIKKIIISPKLFLLHSKYGLQIIFITPKKQKKLITYILQKCNSQNMLPYQILALPLSSFQNLREAVLLHTTKRYTLTYVDEKKQIRGYYTYPYRKKAIKQLMSEIYLLNK